MYSLLLVFNQDERGKKLLIPVKHVNVMFFLYILFCVSLNITICFVNGITLHTNDAYWLLLFVQSTTNELFELCDICDCEFEFNKEDAYLGEDRDGKYWKINCPHCNHQFYSWKINPVRYDSVE